MQTRLYTIVANREDTIIVTALLLQETGIVVCAYLYQSEVRQ